MSERWIIDSMNVIGSRPDGWWKDRRGAMRVFAAQVDEYAASTGNDITVVFDTDPGPLPPPQHIEIVVARRTGRDAADHEIERLVDDADDPRTLRIVTSDQALSERVAAAGGQVVSSGTFRREIDG